MTLAFAAMTFVGIFVVEGCPVGRDVG